MFLSGRGYPARWRNAKLPTCRISLAVSDPFTRHKEQQMKLHTAFFLALSLAAMGPTYAADPSDTKERAEDRYDAKKDAAKQKYEMAKERCESLSGNAKDVCMKEAKAEYTKAESQAKADEKSTKAQAEATEDQMKAEYKAAKERCDAMSGNAKDACIEEAKAKYRQ
jgi:hypothetical protein